jgi:hypothetical protein
LLFTLLLKNSLDLFLISYSIPSTNKGVNMGLDQYAKLKGQKLNFDKLFSDDCNPIEDGFCWRKHARLQVFMNSQWIKQNEHKYKKQLKDAGKGEPFNLSHLGFNAGEVVYMTEEVVKDLEEAIKTDYHKYFANDGFFWGQQFQEQSVKEYKKQDEEFLAFCKYALKNKQVVEYECSW